MRYTAYTKEARAKSSAIEPRRYSGPTLTGPSDETVLQFFRRKVSLLAANDPSIPDEMKSKVVNRACSDEFGLIRSGIQGVYESAREAYVEKKPNEDGAVFSNAPAIIVPKEELAVPEHGLSAPDRSEVGKPDDYLKLRRQMKFLIDSFVRGNSISPVIMNMVVPKLAVPKNPFLPLSNANGEDKSMKAMKILMLHCIEIRKAKGGAIKAACWSHTSRELMEAIRSVDLSDHLVRHQLGIIAMESPFRKVRNVAIHALNKSI